MNCSRCVFVGVGAKCPDCGELSAPRGRSVQTAMESMYGTSQQGRFQPGLGVKTYGKEHFDSVLAAKGLRQKERGEGFVRPRERVKQERRKAFKAVFDEKQRTA